MPATSHQFLDTPISYGSPIWVPIYTRPIRGLTYRPLKPDNPLPSLVHIHGGGFVMGAPEIKDVENSLLASELRCAIYSVDHRLAPEAPLEDIYSVFTWRTPMPANSGLIPPASVSRAKAAAAASRQPPQFTPATSRRQSSPFGNLIYPMIDDRTACGGFASSGDVGPASNLHFCRRS
jgi:alpha/beta hydrolase fold